jgi:hypothetical protein
MVIDTVTGAFAPLAPCAIAEPPMTAQTQSIATPIHFLLLRFIAIPLDSD